MIGLLQTTPEWLFLLGALSTILGVISGVVWGVRQVNMMIEASMVALDERRRMDLRRLEARLLTTLQARDTAADELRALAADVHGLLESERGSVQLGDDDDE